MAFAAIDTFEDEPKPKIKYKLISYPHMGAATLEAQDRIVLLVIKLLNY